MKPKEIMGMDENMLNDKITELKRELVKMNVQASVGTALKNPGQVRKIKKTLARLLTVKNLKSKVIPTKEGRSDKKA